MREKLRGSTFDTLTTIKCWRILHQMEEQEAALARMKPAQAVFERHRQSRLPNPSDDTAKKEENQGEEHLPCFPPLKRRLERNTVKTNSWWRQPRRSPGGQGAPPQDPAEAEQGL